MATAAPKTVSRRLFTVPEACEQLAVCRAHLYGLLRSGTIKSVKIGNSRRIPASEVDRLARFGTEGGGADGDAA